MSKTAGDLALMPRQHDALGQRLADQDQPLRRQALQIDRTAGRNLIVLLGGELDDRRSPPRGA